MAASLFAQFPINEGILDKVLKVVPPHYLGIGFIVLVFTFAGMRLLPIYKDLRTQLVPSKTAVNGGKETLHQKLDTLVSGVEALTKRVDDGFRAFDSRIGVLERGSSVTGNGATSTKRPAPSPNQEKG